MSDVSIQPSELFDEILATLRNLEKSGVRFLEKRSEPLKKGLADNSQEMVLVQSSDANHVIGVVDDCIGIPCAESSKRVDARGSGQSGVAFISAWPCQGGKAADELLEKIIMAMNINPHDAYITSIFKCTPEEGSGIEDSSAFISELADEIRRINPKSAVILGEKAYRLLLGENLTFEKVEGIFQDWRGIKIMPTFHPEELLVDASKKRNVWEAVKKVMSIIQVKV